jgi:hypothetical protein
MYHTGEGLSLYGEGEQALRGAQNTVGFTPHICKGNHDEGCQGRLDKPDLDHIRAATTAACLEQRRELDRARERQARQRESERGLERER